MKKVYWNIETMQSDTYTAEETAALGMVFGLYPPQESLLKKICRQDAFTVYENAEKAYQNLFVI